MCSYLFIYCSNVIGYFCWAAKNGLNRFETKVTPYFATCSSLVAVVAPHTPIAPKHFGLPMKIGQPPLLLVHEDMI